MTLAVVVVAVAFFMVLLSESVIIQSVAAGIRAQTMELREADRFIAHVTSLPTVQSLRVKLAASRSKARISELARVTGIAESDVEQLANGGRGDVAVV